MISSSRRFFSTVSTLAMLTCAACSGQSDSGETVVPFGSLPHAVQKTIAHEIPEQTPDSVELETKDGVSLYEAKELHKDGSKRIVKVDTDGKLVAVINKSAEVVVAWKKVPKAVRKTITENNGGMNPGKVEKEKINGATVYEATTCSAKGKHIIKVAKDGKLIMVKDK